MVFLSGAGPPSSVARPRSGNIDILLDAEKRGVPAW
jgi:hypothetical protein